MKASIRIFLLLSISFISRISAQEISRSPYLQLVGPNSVNIRYRTSSPITSEIQFGASTKTLTRTKKSTPLTQEHEVKIDSLLPNTRYFYRIKLAENKFLGDSTYYFQTAPRIGAKDKISFWSVGDMYPHQPQIDAYTGFQKFRGNAYTNIFLTLGDNVYAGANDGDWQQNFFQVYARGPLLKQSALFPSTGNHDYDNTNRRQDDPNIAYFQNFTLPKQAELNGIPSGSEAYYSYDYGNIHFICLDSHAWGRDNMRIYEGQSEQLDWLKKDLQATKQDWKIIYFHYPLYTKGTYDSDVTSSIIDLRKILAPVFDEYNVDMVMSGHSHVFERSKPVRQQYGPSTEFNPAIHWTDSSNGKYDSSTNSCAYMFSANKKNGTIYVVNGVGGAGSPARFNFPHPIMVYGKDNIAGSFFVEVENNRLDARFLNDLGETLDKFTIFKDLNLQTNAITTVNYGASANLQASWNGSYLWSNNEQTQKITVNPTTTSTYTVQDVQKCLTEKFNVIVNPPLGTLEETKNSFDTAEIIDMSGRIVKKINEAGILSESTFSGLAHGNYILILHQNNQTISIKINY